MVELPPAERIRSFAEVDRVLTEQAALAESDRCLSCCLTCYDPDAPRTMCEAGPEPGESRPAA
jgi:hypothetical protein